MCDVIGPAGYVVDYQALLKQFEHLDHMSPGTFEAEDLDQLIKAVQEMMQPVDSVCVRSVPPQLVGTNNCFKAN